MVTEFSAVTEPSELRKTSMSPLVACSAMTGSGRLP
jgi:hypothetical protein